MGTMTGVPVVCARCGEQHDGTRGPWCGSCEDTTADQELVALIYDDASAIFGLYPVADSARDAMRLDREVAGRARLTLRNVVGQHGARELLGTTE